MRDGNKALRVAHKHAADDGHIRFISATACGFKISLRRTAFQDCYWTNGQDAGIWKAYQPTGETIASLTRTAQGN